MDDLGEKLAGILNDPESMARVKEMAENLLGESKEKQNAYGGFDMNSLLGENIPDFADMQKILNILSLLKGSSNDARSNLLISLKPHLSEPRREKVDTAIKILKIIDILPLLKDSGLLNF